MIGSVRVLELAEPWAERKIYIATARGRGPSPAGQALIEQLLDHPTGDDTADTT